MTEPARFPSSVYADRIARAAQLAARAGISALLITPGPDLHYLVGVPSETHERLTCLVIPTNGTRASIVVPTLEIATLRDSAAGELGLELHTWNDGENAYEIVRGLIPEDGHVVVTEAMPALHLIPLAAALGELPQLATPMIRELRMIKDQAEIAALRRAGDAIDRVHARMGEWLRAGRTEADVAADIEAALIEEGHTSAAFIIVGAGPNGADPHHEVSDRVIEPNDIVVIDIGGPVAPGYNSDSTRTYCVGTPAPEIAEQYALLEKAQAAGVAAVRPGATAEEIDAVTRDVLTEAGLGEFFLHRTGHGIGLSVHEEPYIVAGNDLELRPGMTFSVEPGIYFSGRWGARIEDIVLVTPEGCETLNNQPRGLRSLQ
ncbi:M24 family metallopeptidase [Smaragdicoccus niigatensis]|uniref:M24 family metallopeptidase n=1 Tax=Smaragdicoccus niigatensis TaxID=359359 RepID=UPI000477A771|nr:Xaa-Pro peptidase family protein [Smaragdicoccus niigatensis]